MASTTTIETLREKLRRWEQCERIAGPAFSTGTAALDALLPDGGLQANSLTEWLADGGGGAATLAMRAAKTAAVEGRALVVIDPRGEFYPPALRMPPEKLVVVRPGGARDAAWAWEQVLRCPGVGAVVGWTAGLDHRVFRRLQLAVEKGARLGLLLRPPAAAGEPCWASARWLVTPVRGSPRRVRAQLLRRRYGSPRKGVEVELPDDHETDAGDMAPRMAAAAPLPQAARA